MPAKSPDLSGRLPNSTNPPDCMDMTINLQKNCLNHIARKIIIITTTTKCFMQHSHIVIAITQ